MNFNADDELNQSNEKNEDKIIDAIISLDSNNELILEMLVSNIDEFGKNLEVNIEASNIEEIDQLLEKCKYDLGYTDFLQFAKAVCKDDSTFDRFCQIHSDLINNKNDNQNNINELKIQNFRLVYDNDCLQLEVSFEDNSVQFYDLSSFNEESNNMLYKCKASTRYKDFNFFLQEILLDSLLSLYKVDEKVITKFISEYTTYQIIGAALEYDQNQFILKFINDENYANSYALNPIKSADEKISLTNAFIAKAVRDLNYQNTNQFFQNILLKSYMSELSIDETRAIDFINNYYPVAFDNTDKMTDWQDEKIEDINLISLDNKLILTLTYIDQKNQKIFNRNFDITKRTINNDLLLKKCKSNLGYDTFTNKEFFTVLKDDGDFFNEKAKQQLEQEYSGFFDNTCDEFDFANEDIKIKKLTIKRKKDKKQNTTQFILGINYIINGNKEEKKYIDLDITDIKNGTKNLQNLMDVLECDNLEQLSKEHLHFKGFGTKKAFLNHFNTASLEENKDEPTVKDEEQKDYSKLPMGKIVVFTYQKNGKTIIKAVIFNKDGSYETVSEEIYDKIIELVLDITGKDLNTLTKEGFIEKLPASEVEKNIKRCKQEAMNRDNKQNQVKPKKENKFSLTSWAKKQFSKTKVKVGLFLLGISAIFGAGIGAKKALYPKENVQITNQKNKTSNNNITKKDYTNFTVNKMIDSCQKNNTTRYKFMQKIKNYLTYYNITMANKYKQSSNIKASHTFDEVVSMYLAYNDLNNSKINQIFGSSKINSDELIESIQDSIRQEALIHNIQIESTAKAKYLINNKKIKEKYKEYESIFINMNKTENIETKKQYLMTFYNKVRNDLPNIKTNNYSNVKSHQVMITEFCLAAKNINLSVSNALTKEEENYIKKIPEIVVAKKINNIAKKHKEKLENNTLKKKYTSDGKVPTYKQIKNRLIEVLKNKNAYYITEARRDLSVYTAYKKHTKLSINKVNTASLNSSDEKINNKSILVQEYSNNNLEAQVDKILDYLDNLPEDVEDYSLKLKI